MARKKPPRPKRKPGLTDKQAAFVREYLIDLNATQAAARAGYSRKTANEQGARLLANASVAAAVSAAQAKLAIRAEISQQWVINNLRDVANRCMQAEPVLDREGNPTGEYTFNAPGANRALELIGKHLGMFVERVDQTVTITVVEDEQWYGQAKHHSAEAARTSVASPALPGPS